jgi:hypothetical protein
MNKRKKTGKQGQKKRPHEAAVSTFGSGAAIRAG